MTDTTQQPCRVCRKPFNAYPLGEKNGFELEACRACGSVLVNPEVTEEQREEFFGIVEPKITHIPNHEAEIERLKKVILKVEPQPQGKTFLDVGSQYGYAVSAAKQLGMKAHGVEKHDHFIEFLHEKYENGKEIFQHIRLQDYAATNPPKYDFIYSTENFGMETQPEEFAQAIADLLAPSGKVYIHEPDGNHFNLPRQFVNWEIAYPPINFVYYSKKGMAALLARHGLAIKHKYFSWRPFMRLYVTKK